MENRTENLDRIRNLIRAHVADECPRCGGTGSVSQVGPSGNTTVSGCRVCRSSGRVRLPEVLNAIVDELESLRGERADGQATAALPERPGTS